MGKDSALGHVNGIAWLAFLVWDGTATPEQLSDKGRISTVVIAGIVLALVSVAVQVRPPRSRLLSHVVADGCYLGIAELLIWYFIPDHFLLVGLAVGAAALIAFSLHREVADYLPHIKISWVPSRKHLIHNRDTEVGSRQDVVPPTLSKLSPAPREFASANPDYLTGFFEQYTNIQAQKLLLPFIGKWMRVLGSLGDVKEMDKNTILVDVQGQYGSRTRPAVLFYFDAVWLHKFAAMAPGTPLKIIGKITNADQSFLILRECELED